jgi:ATP-dependent Clp protease protease subunit
MGNFWGTSLLGKKRRRRLDDENDDDEEDTKPSSSLNIYSQDNHIYFTEGIDSNTAFALNKELRILDKKLRIDAVAMSTDPRPIYLHLTTDGGYIHSAFSIIDCMKSLKVPVYTVIDGYVASAGTLISVYGNKRYIQPNAYVLIHELRSGFWGKMTYLDEEHQNCKKIQEHLTKTYLEKTKLTKSRLTTILKQDLQFNADEALQMGIADEIYI